MQWDYLHSISCLMCAGGDGSDKTVLMDAMLI